jgi:hypothetical protein
MSDLRQQLLEIREQYGGQLTPEFVVNEARDPAHVLHARVFDKAPADAAEAYYLDRARSLIRMARVVSKSADEYGPEKSVRAFHAVRTDLGRSYEPTEKIAEDPLQRKMLLRQMEHEWQALKRRYDDLVEFWDLVRAEPEIRQAG